MACPHRRPSQHAPPFGLSLRRRRAVPSDDERGGLPPLLSRRLNRWIRLRLVARRPRRPHFRCQPGLFLHLALCPRRPVPQRSLLPPVCCACVPAPRRRTCKPSRFKPERSPRTKRRQSIPAPPLTSAVLLDAAQRRRTLSPRWVAIHIGHGASFSGFPFPVRKTEKGR